MAALSNVFDACGLPIDHAMNKFLRHKGVTHKPALALVFLQGHQQP